MSCPHDLPRHGGGSCNCKAHIQAFARQLPAGGAEIAANRAEERGEAGVAQAIREA